VEYYSLVSIFILTSTRIINNYTVTVITFRIWDTRINMTFTSSNKFNELVHLIMKQLAINFTIYAIIWTSATPLNTGSRNRKNMKLILSIILIQLTVAFALLIPSLTTEWIMAQAQIITVPMPANNTKLILDMKNHTQTLVNATTNETISVENFTLYRGNATTNESPTTNAGNATTNVNLTAKFKALQGK